MAGRKFLIIAFDGLRPDMVTPGLMPHLCRFQDLGVRLARHRAVFPTDTRANVASMVTGAYPGAHGFLGNAFYDPVAHPDAVFNTMHADLIESCDAAHDGHLFTTDSLGDLLGRRGMSVAVIGAASRGTTRALHHKVRRYPQHICISCHYSDISVPGDVLQEVTDRFGMPPEPARPDLAAMTYGTDVFLGHVWPVRKPDLSIIWFNEPDTSYHWFGVKSPQALEALAHADREFGRILDWWEQEGRQQDVQLMAVSDHGHISTQGRVDTAAHLAQAGFAVQPALRRDADLVVVPASATQVYVGNPQPRQLAGIVDFLLQQSWCGMVFSPDRTAIDGVVPGTFARSLVFANHQRSPDIIFTLRADDEADQYGLNGRSLFDSDIAYRSMHGGLHPKELECLAVAAGSFFRAGAVVEEPSGVVDLAPTILQGLGLPSPDGLQGRVLLSALAQGGEPDAPRTGVSETFEARHGHHAQWLRRLRVGNSVYLDGGWSDAWHR